MTRHDDRTIPVTSGGPSLTRRSLMRLAASTTAVGASVGLAACGSSSGRTEIEVIQYKQEAVKVFEELEGKFNATHDDIHLTITSPNDATTVIKTRFIREDYPDIIGIGGDINYSNFVDANILADLSDYAGLDNVKQSYRDILESLEYVPTEGSFGVPYMSNAAGILYNRQMFEQHGWALPGTWTELCELCERIRGEGVLPIYFGFKDTWTCAAPWNALAVELAPIDLYQQVNEGRATFSDYYREPAEKLLKLCTYAEDGPVAFDYNSACTAFANGEAAMYPIGSYAVPQILSANPDMDIDSFVMPGSDDTDKLVLNSGVDLQFCVCAACRDKEAAYEVLDFFQEHGSQQGYVNEQNAVPCSTGDFRLPGMLDGMRDYINDAKVADYQDHHYPDEMSVPAMLQTLVIDGDVDAFLAKFDADWTRYNRDVIRKVQEYSQAHGQGGN